MLHLHLETVNCQPESMLKPRFFVDFAQITTINSLCLGGDCLTKRPKHACAPLQHLCRFRCTNTRVNACAAVSAAVRCWSRRTVNRSLREPRVLYALHTSAQHRVSHMLSGLFAPSQSVAAVACVWCVCVFVVVTLRVRYLVVFTTTNYYLKSARGRRACAYLFSRTHTRQNAGICIPLCARHTPAPPCLGTHERTSEV